MRLSSALRDELRKLSWTHAAVAVCVAGWAVWASGAAALAPAYVVVAAAAVPLFAIDVRERRLPNALTLPLIPATATLLLFGADLDSWLRALLAGLALGAAYLALHLISPSGLGMGDVKLVVTLGMLGGWHGWAVAVAVGAAAFFAAVPTSIVLLVTRRGRTFPFGPYMLVGAAVVLTAVRLVT